VEKELLIDDMVTHGVVDSFKVVQTYLKDSVSLSGLILATECMIVKEKNYEPRAFSHYQNQREFF